MSKDQFRPPEPHEIAAKREFMLQQVSEDFPSKLNHFKKSYNGSLRSAITAKCIECMWGDVRAIRECTTYACPLWEQRPYREARKPHNPSTPEKAESSMDDAEVNDETPGDS